MRQLKTFMRKRKEDILWCGDCSCYTLQCWRNSDVNCGCWGDSADSKILNSIIASYDAALFFTYNLEPDDGDDFWGVMLETDPETWDNTVVVQGGGKYEPGWEKALPGVQMLTSLVEDMNIEIVKNVFFSMDGDIIAGTVKPDVFNLMEKLLLTWDETTAQELSSAIENLYNEGENLGDFDADTATIYFTQQSGIWNPKTDEWEEVKSDYVNLSKKSVTVPVWTLMKVEFSEDDRNVYFVFYDENETEIDRVTTKSPSDNMQYSYYTEEYNLWEYAFEWDDEREWYIVKSSTEVQVEWGAVILMQITIAVEPKWWGTTNYKKIWAPYQSQRTVMTAVQGTWYFKIYGQGKEFIISASPDTSIINNHFGGWKVNWERAYPDHWQIEDDMALTAIFTDDPR